MKVKGKHVILSLVCLVLGFMISFSYQFTKNAQGKATITDKQWEKEYEYRTKLIEQEKRNRDLLKDRQKKQEKIRSIEEELAKQRTTYSNVVEEVEKLRMFVGEIGVQGNGVEVTLSDAEYVPSEENVNNYIVHQGHVFKVVNELFISGATGIAINGQRITHHSYILCNGPVIEIDGNQYPEPFVITAIGEPGTLFAALNINGGVKDQLINDNITVKIAKKNDIIINPLLSTQKE